MGTQPIAAARANGSQAATEAITQPEDQELEETLSFCRQEVVLNYDRVSDGSRPLFRSRIGLILNNAFHWTRAGWPAGRPGRCRGRGWWP